MNTCSKEDFSLIENVLQGLKKADEQTVLTVGNLAIPDRKTITQMIKNLQALLFPMAFRRASDITDAQLLLSIYHTLHHQVCVALNFVAKGNCTDCQKRADEICHVFLNKLGEIKSLLFKDIQALYEGDPAASSQEEILICYPGFYAISIYRMAHELYRLKVPLLPRIMTEYAHEKTGIDIHAGATIGEYFFIDHGTGIVIGETTVIGNHVKLYQGVTLGAKSFELDTDGNPVKGVKRHPNIGNNVIIYANATILGGETTIGDNCIIGGNTWLVHSVPSGQTVYYNG